MTHPDPIDLTLDLIGERPAQAAPSSSRHVLETIPPPVESKHPSVRYFHIHEGEGIDATLVGNWIEQAAALPVENLC